MTSHTHKELTGSTNYPKQPSASLLDLRHTQNILDPCQANPTIGENLSERTPVSEQLCLFCGDELRHPGLAPGMPSTETSRPDHCAVRVGCVANTFVRFWLSCLCFPFLSIGSEYAERNPLVYADSQQQVPDSSPGIYMLGNRLFFQARWNTFAPTVGEVRKTHSAPIYLPLAKNTNLYPLCSGHDTCNMAR
jgi:hypothetical protein